MGVNLSGSTPTTPGTPGGIAQAIHDAIAAAGGIGGVLAGVVNGIIGGIVGAVQSIAGLIGGLFGMSSRDMAAVDQARVNVENAIVANIGQALDQFDEIQRAGGAYMDYPRFQLGNGGKTPHVLPLNTQMTLQEGTTWAAPVSPLTHGGLYNSVESNYERMAQASGYLELTEPGFWRIDFQAAVLQASAYYAEPSEVWCYVTPASSPYLPLGAPGLDENGNALGATQCVTRHRSTGIRSIESDLIHAFGRSSAYVDQLETDWSGGNTIAGTVFVLIPSGGYKVTMACSAYEHFSGGSSTFVMATKVNSQSLRDEIDALKTQIATALPGTSTNLELNDTDIAAMVAEADAIDVMNEETP